METFEIPTEVGQNKMVAIDAVDRKELLAILKEKGVNTIGGAAFAGLDVGKELTTKVLGFKTRLGMGKKGAYNMLYLSTIHGDVQCSDVLFLTAALQQEVVVKRLADRLGDDGKSYKEFSVSPKQ